MPWQDSLMISSLNLYHHLDVEGCSGGAGSRAEGFDVER